MSEFNRDALRKGAKAIDEAVEEAQAARAKAQQDYRPFLPNIYWKEDQEAKYLLFLNTIDDIPTVDFHPYVETDDGFPHMAIARTDDSIGDNIDLIQERWSYKPRRTSIGVAVELDPVTKMVNGREKPVGFEVKTVSFERRIRDENGELTEDREEVWAPIVGLVTQSPHNFYNAVSSFDVTEAPIHTTPVKITRLGKKENVHYQVTGYENVDVDLTNLLEYIDNVNYVEDPDALFASIDDKEGFEASTVIGAYLLDKRLEELGNLELYTEILDQISQPSRFGEKTKKSGGRPPRPSQRRKREQRTQESDDRPTARSREPEEEVTRMSSPNERLERLRSKVKPSE